MQQEGQMDLAYGTVVLWKYENGCLYMVLLDSEDNELWSDSALDDDQEICSMDSIDIEQFNGEVFGRDIRNALHRVGLTWSKPAKIKDLKAHLKKMISQYESKGA